MRNYELVIVLDGKATAAKKKSTTEKIEKLIKEVKGLSAQAGKVGEIKDWGVKDLSYKIKKSTTGVYLILPLELEGEGAKSLSNKLRLEGDLIRYLIVRKD